MNINKNFKQMKKSTGFVLLIGCLLGINFPLSGQTYIYLDKDFLAASKPMTAKRKGISSIGKYEFGTYKIISGKAGWTTTKGRTGFFSGDTRSESKTVSSFLFTGNDMDTITANIVYTSETQIDEQYGFVFRTLTNWSNQRVASNHEAYLVNYISSQDTSQWNMILSYPVAGEIVGEISQEMISSFRGTLTNSEITIDIVPELRWENGKYGTLFKPVEGYVFNLEGETVAAVQVFPSNKMFAWISQNTPENLKFILAAGLATMMVRSE